MLSQAEGHQGVALEFLRHSWAVPEVAFPDPVGLSLLGINMVEPRSRGGGESLVKTRTLGSGACTLSAWGQATPDLSFLTWKMGLD